MPPGAVSRHQFSFGVKDDFDRLYLTDRTRYLFKNFPDNVEHEVREGDTLFNLAARYFRPLERAAGFWWVIADFQPTPILDPTIKLAIGARVVVPSIRTLQESILSPSRSSES